MFITLLRILYGLVSDSRKLSTVTMSGGGEKHISRTRRHGVLDTPLELYIGRQLLIPLQKNWENGQ